MKVDINIFIAAFTPSDLSAFGAGRSPLQRSSDWIKLAWLEHSQAITVRE